MCIRLWVLSHMSAMQDQYARPVILYQLSQGAITTNKSDYVLSAPYDRWDEFPLSIWQTPPPKKKQNKSWVTLDKVTDQMTSSSCVCVYGDIQPRYDIWEGFWQVRRRNKINKSYLFALTLAGLGDSVSSAQSYPAEVSAQKSASSVRAAPSHWPFITRTCSAAT